MAILARAVASAALLTLTAVADLEAQVGSVRFTIAGGPHAGSYRFQTGQCDVLGGRGKPISIISMFTSEMQGGRAEPNSPASFETDTATTASFRAETTNGVRIEGSLTCPT